jgi:hypothetical protein
MELAKMTELDVQPILCSIPKAGATINHCTRFIYEKIATGEIEAVKSGKRTLVVVASLHKYAEKLPPAKIKPITRRPVV